MEHMTKVTITPQRPGSQAGFRAAGHGRETVGATPGAALDLLAQQLGPEQSNTLIVVQNMRPTSSLRLLSSSACPNFSPSAAQHWMAATRWSPPIKPNCKTSLTLSLTERCAGRPPWFKSCNRER